MFPGSDNPVTQTLVTRHWSLYNLQLSEFFQLSSPFHGVISDLDHLKWSIVPLVCKCIHCAVCWRWWCGDIAALWARFRKVPPYPAYQDISRSISAPSHQIPSLVTRRGKIGNLTQHRPWNKHRNRDSLSFSCPELG